MPKRYEKSNGGMSQPEGGAGKAAQGRGDDGENPAGTASHGQTVSAPRSPFTGSPAMADSVISEQDLSDEEVMAKYGISCVPTDRFHYKSFRYSRLSDALAQARRDQSPASTRR